MLSRLGLPVAMISKTGTDFLSDSLVDLLRKDKIDTKYVFRSPKVLTSLAFSQIDVRGNSSYFFYKTKSPSIKIPQRSVPSSIFKTASVFHTGSSFPCGDSNHTSILSFAKASRRNKTFVSFDPNWREKRAKNEKIARARIRILLPHVDLLKLSDADALGITGCKNLSRALISLEKDLSGFMVVTLGNKGSLFKKGSAVIRHPAFNVNIVDTIGAGDAFMAGLLYHYILKGKSRFEKHIKESLTFASASAALVCRGKGATEGLKSVTQVERFMRSHRAG